MSLLDEIIAATLVSLAEDQAISPDLLARLRVLAKDDSIFDAKTLREALESIPLDAEQGATPRAD